MKHHSTLMAAMLLTLLVSCYHNRNAQSGTENPGIEKESIVEELVQIESQSEIELQASTFDWTIPQQLKKQLKLDLDNNPNEADKLIIRFLGEYGKVEREFNDILFGLSNYDSLNTLAYAPDDVIYENAYEFKDLAESNGFSIAMSEGMIYLTKNTDFIKSSLIEVRDSISVEFVHLYCQEIEEVCCEDAGIIISDKELVNRAFCWGNFLEKAQHLEYRNIAESEFNSYLSLIYNGQENTPSFDWQTKEFSRNIFDLMIEIIKTYPDSKAAIEFKEFTELLVSEGFKRTEKIDDYLVNR